ncbi:MAG: hypothetical protein J7L61_04665 [Thermoplasmata archaeon]|nr:hypothetical protein [Thermoplasmata archaeon]
MGKEGDFGQTRKRFAKDNRAALEGLPLYMVILVVIATVAMVVLLTWMQGAQKIDLDRITVDPDTAKDGKETKITVIAYDTSGKPLEGATVTLDGCGVALIKKTSSTGKATFTITPDLGGDHYGVINVEVTYTGTLQKKVTDTIAVSG